MSNAYIFPGQGAQFVGMGHDLYETFPVARKLLDEAETVTGIPLRHLCFEGPMDQLSDTAVSQPALVACSIAALEVAREMGIPKPAYVLGLSLGEYAALYAAGVLSSADAVGLVRQRGLAMKEAGAANPGTMTSVLGAEDAVIRDIVARAAEKGVINVANFNCPGQVVLSGAVPAIEFAEQLLSAVPRVRAIRLSVSGAFHSPLMKPAADKLALALERVEWHPPQVPVIQNVTGEAVGSVPEIKLNLVAQLTGSVQFEKSVNRAKQLGVDRLFELGPGKVLAGLVRRIDRNLPVINVGTATEAESLRSVAH
ncbi:MAG: ACP S-malonyltransferase [Candidatus Brocadiia bacterium]